MNKSYKQILMDAGRYDEVLNVLENIYNTTESDFPTATLIRYSNSSGRVFGPDVRRQARKLLKSLEYETDPGAVHDYISLLEYVSSHVDISLHNYANNLSHKKEPLVDLEEIRVWHILQSLIEELDFLDEDWSIPDGWKADSQTQNITM